MTSDYLPHDTQPLFASAAAHFRDSCDTFVALLGPVARARIQRYTRLDIQHPDDLLQWLDPDFLLALPALSPRHIDLLALLDAHLEAPSLRLAGLIEQACGDAGWIAVSGERVAVNPCAVVALAARYLHADPHSDSVVLWSLYSPLQAASLRLLLHQLTITQIDLLIPKGQGGRLVQAQRQLQRLPSAPSLSIPQAAAVVRAALLTLAQQDARDTEALAALRPILDVPEPEGPLWRSARMQELLRSDVDLLRRWVTTDAGLLPADHVLHAAADRIALDPCDCVQWLTNLPARTSHRPALAAFPARAWTAPGALSLSAARDALTALVGTLPCPTRTMLVDIPASALGALGWPLVLQIADRHDLHDSLTTLIEHDPTDWADFDAPGEGSLPSLWMRALFAAGLLDQTWRTRLALIDSELQMPDPDAEIPDVLSGYASLALASESRLGLDESPMSSYAHGLHDAVGEAYGDVWSAADPFSVRKRSEQ
jgi:hypothetical protein